MADEEQQVEECRSEYERLMKEKLVDPDNISQDEFDEWHETSKDLAIKFILKKYPVEDEDDVDLEQFDEAIEECCEELQNLVLVCSTDVNPSDEESQSDQSDGHPGQQNTNVKKNIDNLSGDSGSEPDDCDDDDDDDEDVAIGIDLGTTNCCVAVYYNNKVNVIPNQNVDGSTTTPSYVSIQRDGSTIIGLPAKETAYRNPESTVYDAKRIIGRPINDPALQEDIKFWPFNVIEDDGVPKIQIYGKAYHPEEISAFLLMEMKSIAERFLKKKPGSIKKAVITVPAYFTDGQRQATMDAGVLAGLQVLTVLNEPTAAAIAYTFERLDQKAKHVLIFDLGGGTFDVAVLEMKAGEITVLGVDGDSHLGGEDFDQNMMKFCANVFKDQENVDLFENKDSTVAQQRAETRRNLRRLQLHCERSKKFVSSARKTEVTLDALVDRLDLYVEIKRDDFDKMNEELFQRAIQIVKRALEAAELKKQQIDDIVLIGGSSRIPKMKALLVEYFNKKQLNESINPDEAVAYGAAVQAAILTGKAADKFKLKNINEVCSMSVGTEVITKDYSVIIPKNTRIPAKVTKEYHTVYDNQTEVQVKIYEGEKKIAAENNLLGKFILSGIPPAPAYEETIQVTMLINHMGILHVEALSKGNKNKASITVNQNKNRMSKDEIERVLRERGLPPPEP